MSKSIEKKRDFFWLSYSDLMTSLFFVMLVLFVIVFAVNSSNQKRLLDYEVKLGEIQGQYDTLVAAKEELDEIRRIQKALEKLDRKYFEFDKRNKRYKLKTEVNFNSNSASIIDIPLQTRLELLNAGKSLYTLMDSLTRENPDVNYLLIVEGNTQRSLLSGGWNYLTMPDTGYKLSYNRALALVNYWKKNKVDFMSFDNCEILISGSGYFGKARDSVEGENRKFTIQITPKIGDIKKKKTKRK